MLFQHSCTQAKKARNRSHDLLQPHCAMDVTYAFSWPHLIGWEQLIRHTPWRRCLLSKPMNTGSGVTDGCLRSLLTTVSSAPGYSRCSTMLDISNSGTPNTTVETTGNLHWSKINLRCQRVLILLAILLSLLYRSTRNSVLFS